MAYAARSKADKAAYQENIGWYKHQKEQKLRWQEEGKVNFDK